MRYCYLCCIFTPAVVELCILDYHMLLCSPRCYHLHTALFTLSCDMVLQDTIFVALQSRARNNFATAKLLIHQWNSLNRTNSW